MRTERLHDQAKETVQAFHAKDDLPEVSREVFILLHQCKDLCFWAVVRDKRKVLTYVQQRNKQNQYYRYHPNELYDYLVRHLFSDRMHQGDIYEIYFTKQGKPDRTRALREALEAV